MTENTWSFEGYCRRLGYAISSLRITLQHSLGRSLLTAETRDTLCRMEPNLAGRLVDVNKRIIHPCREAYRDIFQAVSMGSHANDPDNTLAVLSLQVKDVHRITARFLVEHAWREAIAEVRGRNQPLSIDRTILRHLAPGPDPYLRALVHQPTDFSITESAFYLWLRSVTHRNFRAASLPEGLKFLRIVLNQAVETGIAQFIPTRNEFAVPSHLISRQRSRGRRIIRRGI